MKSTNVLVALAIVQAGTLSRPAFARAGFPNAATGSTVSAETPAAPRSLKGAPPKPTADRIRVVPANEPASFTNRFSSICNQMLSFPPAKENGARSDAYEVAADLATPRQQVSRLIDLGPDESFRARLMRKFKALLGRAEKASTEVNVYIPDIGTPNIDLETKRTLEQVAARIDELESDAYQKPNSHYLMRHAHHARKPIRVYLKRMLLGAQKMDAALVASLHPPETPAVVTPPVHIPTVDLAPPAPSAEVEEPALPVNPDYNFPYNIDWSNVKTWSKQLGLATAAGMGTVFMLYQDPRWVVGTMVGVGAGVLFMSAPLRDRVGQFKGWIKSVIDRRKNGVPETFEETLAKRLERTRIQTAVLQKMIQRMEGNANEYGLSYYSYVAEAEAPHALSQPVVPVGVPPRPQPAATMKLVRVEHILYTNLNSHRLLTFVSDLSAPLGPFTEVSLVHQ